MTKEKWCAKLDIAAKTTLVALAFAIPITNSGMSILVIATVILTLLAGNWRKIYTTVLHNRVATVAVIFYGLFLLSIIYGAAPWHNIVHGLKKYDKLLLIPVFIPLFFDPKVRECSTLAFILAMLVTLVVSFMKMFGWIHIGHSPSLTDLFRNHIDTGFLMAFAAFLLAHRTFNRGRIHWFYGFLCLIVCYNVLFMNDGRTGYMAFALLFVLFLWQKLGWKGFLAACIVGPIAAVFLFTLSTPFKDRIVQSDHGIKQYQHGHPYTSIGYRLLFAKYSFKLIKDHPLLGTGVGSFRPEYNGRGYPKLPDTKILGSPHNEYILVTVELGVVGLLVLLFLFYTMWRTSFRLPDDDKQLTHGLLVAFMPACLTAPFIFLFVPGYFFIYFTSMLYAPLREAEVRSQESEVRLRRQGTEDRRLNKGIAS